MKKMIAAALIAAIFCNLAVSSFAQVQTFKRANFDSTKRQYLTALEKLAQQNARDPQAQNVLKFLRQDFRLLGPVHAQKTNGPTLLLAQYKNKFFALQLTPNVDSRPAANAVHMLRAPESSQFLERALAQFVVQTLAPQLQGRWSSVDSKDVSENVLYTPLVLDKNLQQAAAEAAAFFPPASPYTARAIYLSENQSAIVIIKKADLDPYPQWQEAKSDRPVDFAARVIGETWELTTRALLQGADAAVQWFEGIHSAVWAKTSNTFEYRVPSAAEMKAIAAAGAELTQLALAGSLSSAFRNALTRHFTLNQSGSFLLVGHGAKTVGNTSVRRTRSSFGRWGILGFIVLAITLLCVVFGGGVQAERPQLRGFTQLALAPRNHTGTELQSIPANPQGSVFEASYRVPAVDNDDIAVQLRNTTFLYDAAMKAFVTFLLTRNVAQAIAHAHNRRAYFDANNVMPSAVDMNDALLPREFVQDTGAVLFNMMVEMQIVRQTRDLSLVTGIRKMLDYVLPFAQPDGSINGGRDGLGPNSPLRTWAASEHGIDWLAVRHGLESVFGINVDRGNTNTWVLKQMRDELDSAGNIIGIRFLRGRNDPAWAGDLNPFWILTIRPEDVSNYRNLPESLKQVMDSQLTNFLRTFTVNGVTFTGIATTDQATQGLVISPEFTFITVAGLVWGALLLRFWGLPSDAALYLTKARNLFTPLYQHFSSRNSSFPYGITANGAMRWWTGTFTGTTYGALSAANWGKIAEIALNADPEDFNWNIFYFPVPDDSKDVVRILIPLYVVFGVAICCGGGVLIHLYYKKREAQAERDARQNGQALAAHVNQQSSAQSQRVAEIEVEMKSRAAQGTPSVAGSDSNQPDRSVNAEEIAARQASVEKVRAFLNSTYMAEPAIDSSDAGPEASPTSTSRATVGASPEKTTELKQVLGWRVGLQSADSFPRVMRRGQPYQRRARVDFLRMEIFVAADDTNLIHHEVYESNLWLSLFWQMTGQSWHSLTLPERRAWLLQMSEFFTEHPILKIRLELLFHEIANQEFPTIAASELLQGSDVAFLLVLPQRLRAPQPRSYDWVQTAYRTLTQALQSQNWQALAQSPRIRTEIAAVVEHVAAVEDSPTAAAAEAKVQNAVIFNVQDSAPEEIALLVKAVEAGQLRFDRSLWVFVTTPGNQEKLTQELGGNGLVITELSEQALQPLKKTRILLYGDASQLPAQFAAQTTAQSLTDLFSASVAAGHRASISVEQSLLSHIATAMSQ